MAETPLLRFKHTDNGGNWHKYNNPPQIQKSTTNTKINQKYKYSPQIRKPTTNTKLPKKGYFGRAPTRFKTLARVNTLSVVAEVNQKGNKAILKCTDTQLNKNTIAQIHKLPDSGVD